jgi:hypothetical protein
MAIPIDEFIAGQMPGVKGLPFTPGEHGFPEGISTGRMHAAAQANVLGQSAKTSFWWNLGSETDMSIYDIARGAIGYANAERLRLQSSPGNVANQAAAEGMGITPKALQDLVLNSNNRGSIAFTNLSRETSSFYSGGGESMGQAIQTTDQVSRYTRMTLPESVFYQGSGPVVNDNLGKPMGLTESTLKNEASFHDWMKEFAQNVKDTTPEGTTLPKGTQELLDLGTVNQMNAAAESRLIEAGIADRENLQFKGITQLEGRNAYLFTFTKEGQDGGTHTLREQGLLPHIQEVKKNIPPTPNRFTSKITPVSQIGERTDNLIPTSSKPFSQVAATMEKAENLEASGKIARNNVAMTVDDGVELAVRRSSSTARMLGSAADASAAVAKGVSGSSMLRSAGAALNILA